MEGKLGRVPERRFLSFAAWRAEAGRWTCWSVAAERCDLYDGCVIESGAKRLGLKKKLDPRKHVKVWVASEHFLENINIHDALELNRYMSVT